MSQKASMRLARRIMRDAEDAQAQLETWAAWVKRFYGPHTRGYVVRVPRPTFERLLFALMLNSPLETCDPMQGIRIRNVIILPRSGDND